VLADIEAAEVELIVSCGDLTWGSHPDETIAAMRGLGGHTHLQFDRRVAGRRSVNPGSVGLPYHEGEPGTAYWALLGPDVTLRQTRYDIAAALQAGAAVGDPGAAKITDLLMSPPSPAEIIAETERLVFSD
jgi:diadenosine tetraphosphatase ApaH/serine/threonine PP2A family protein phosphatase